MSLTKLTFFLKSTARAPTLIILFVLWLNLIGFYLIFHVIFLFFAWMVLTGVIILLIVLFLYKQSKPNPVIFAHQMRSNAQPEIRFNLTYIVKLTKKQVKINRVYILASIIGLSLAMIIISQIYLINATYHQESFDRYVNQANPSAYEFTMTGVDNQAIFDEWDNKINTEIGTLLDSYDIDIRTYHTYGQVTASIILGEEVDERMNQRWVNTLRFKTRTWTQERLDFYKNFPTFNKSMVLDLNERFLIIPSYLAFGDTEYYEFDWIRNNTVQILVDAATRASMKDTIFMNFTYSITNYWQPQEEDYRYLVDNQLTDYRDLLREAMYLPKGYEWSFLDSILFVDAHNTRIKFNFHRNLYLKTIIYTDIPLFDDISVISYEEKIRETIAPFQSWANLWATEMTEIYNPEFDLFVSVYSPLRNAINTFTESIGPLKEYIVIISSPLVAISLYLVHFSINIVQKRRDNIVSTMKQRGTSNSQVQMMMVSEILVGGTSASIVGMILSIPWTSLSLRSSGILEFGEEGVGLVIPNSWYIVIPVVGFLIAFDLHALSILGMAKITTDLSVNKVLRAKQPLWQQAYLDVIVFGMSLSFWIYLKYVPIGREAISDFIVFDIGPYMIALMLITSPVVFQRYYTNFVNFLFNILVKLKLVKDDLLNLAKVNIIRNRYTSSRMASLLMTGFILALVTITVPYSFDQWTYENAYYENGADILIEDISLYEITRFNLLNISGIEGFTEIVKLDVFIPNPYTVDISELVNYYSMLAINPVTFSEIAFWMDYYSKYSIEHLTEALEDDYSIGMSEALLDGLGLEIGDIFTLPQTILKREEIVNLRINTTFDYFPKLMHEIPRTSAFGQVDIDTIELVTSLATIELIANYYQIPYVSNVYVKVANGFDIDEVAAAITKELEHDLSQVVTSVNRRHVTLFSKEQFQLINSTLQGLLIIAISTVFVAYAYMVFVNTKDRKREMGLYKSFGMVSSQFKRMFIYESIFFLSIASVIGIILGLLIAASFFVLITGTEALNIPPIKPSINYIGVLIFMIILLVINYFANIIPVKMISNMDTSSLLRTD